MRPNDTFGKAGSTSSSGRLPGPGTAVGTGVDAGAGAGVVVRAAVGEGAAASDGVDAGATTACSVGCVAAVETAEGSPSAHANATIDAAATTQASAFLVTVRAEVDPAIVGSPPKGRCHF